MRLLLIFFTVACMLALPLQSYSIGHFSNNYDTSIKPGAARTGDYIPLFKGKKVAIIINQTSQVGNASLLDVLLKNNVNVVKIFVPEHGFRGNADAGASVANAVDSATGLPVISLYGSNKKPKAEQLTDVDIVVYDLQDVGVRFYTYIGTLEYAMEACAENDKDFLVLDRPNPNGFYIDGPVLDTQERSFVGMQLIPIVYGMTPGEYAGMLVGEHWIRNAGKLKLKVITCEGYDHSKRYLLPVVPSPNLKTMAAIYAYPSMCLFEGTTISVGRGTGLPFQQWGSPDLNGKFMYHFTPMSIEGAKSPLYEGKECYGEAIGNSEAVILKKTGGKIYLGWLLKAYTACPAKGKFFNDFFEKLAGTRHLKEQIIAGTSETQIRESWQPGLEKFKKIRASYLLYKDF